MTDRARGTGVPEGPPWSVDVLADLHAGVLDPRESAALRTRIAGDREAQAVLAALDGVGRDLHALGDAPEPMPAHLAARLDAAIAAEAARTMPAASRPGIAPVVDMAEARRRRNRRLGWAAGVVTAAAAVLAVAFVALPTEQSTGGTPQAQDGGNADEAPQNVPPLALKGDDLGPAVGGLTGEEDYGPLDDEDGLTACLTDQGIEEPQVIGVREVTLDGEPGVAALLAGGEDGHRFRLLIVTPDCSGDPITDASIG